MHRAAPLNALRVFVAAARLGSFKLAAKVVCVTPSAVSRRIQALEEHLGARLFARLPHTLALTRAGKLFLSEVGDSLTVIEQACSRVSATVQRGALRIETTSTFAMYWLIPRLSQFRNEHPEIQVELTTTRGPVDPDKPVHLFIRSNPGHVAGLVSQEFMRERSLLVCSPSYLRRNDVSSAKAVARLRWIVARSRPDLWRKWLIHESIRGRDHADRIEFDDTILAIQAAMEGLGIAFLPMLFLEDALRVSSLVAVRGFAPIDTGAYFWLGQQSERPACSDLFVRWLAVCGRSVEANADDPDSRP